MSYSERIRARWNAPQGYREVLRVGLPLVASMASATVMQFTDRLFLSHYSVTSIAAAMPAGMAALVFQLMFVGLCGYVAVLTAQYMGANLPHRVGAALWQGIWLALVSTLLLSGLWFIAEPLFVWAGHTPAIQAEEVVYFRILILGSVFFLLGSVVSGFFIGRGHTRPVFIANLAGALLNIPLDYAMIFGAWGMPEMGIAGAALATVTGWALCTAILAACIFTRRNDQLFSVRRAWRLERELFGRLLHFGLPSGCNLFLEVVGFSWFILEIGRLGEVSQAASSIAFSLNSVIFTPMLGLNNAVSALVGQAMGRRKPLEAEAAATSALHLSLFYMLFWVAVFVLFAGWLVALFLPSGGGADLGPIRELSIVLLYYVALYSLLDSFNLIYIGALKGAGDTRFIMLIMAGTALFCLLLPIVILQWLDLATVHRYWWVFTAYIMIMAACARARFRRRGWHALRVIED